MLTAYTDGGARGNPGPAGYGVQVVNDDGAVVAELYAPLGHTTNNVAEYRGLIAALAWAVEHKAAPLRVRMDSELIVKQMRGIYKVKHAGLQPLHAEARALVTEIGRVVFEHVRREQNREADRLSNLAMDLASGQRPEALATADATTDAALSPDVSSAPAPRVIAIPRPAGVAARPETRGRARPVAPVHSAHAARFDFDSEE
jgi:probable phosphoglycerate mutase